MKEVIIWAIHTPAGGIGLLTAAIALLTNKGVPLHRKAGTYFTISMLIMLISGFIAALLKGSIGDMFLSAVVTYTVFTAWLTIHHKRNETGLLEYLALAWILIIAIAAFVMNTSGQAEISSPNLFTFWATFAVACAIGDARNLYRAGLPSTQRIIRHVWRIGFSLIWAVLALTDKIIKIQGSNIQELPIENIIVTVAAPTIFMLLIILYWVLNILFFSRLKFSNYGG